MRVLHIARRLSLLAAGVSAGVVLVASTANAAQGPVGLGTADSFGVLAGSGITNTGATTITGDIGTFPTVSETGTSDVTLHGTDHAGDAVTQGAKNDLVTAYNDAAGRNPATSVPVELGGKTLLPGVYTSPTFGLTGTLTLDAQGDPNAEFIFKAGSTLITATDSQVLVVNGATACNVVWQVGSSATFGTRTEFVGNVLAHTSISANDSASFQGRLLAREGAVTLIHDTITRPSCAATLPTSPPTATQSSGPVSTPPSSPPSGQSSTSPSSSPSGPGSTPTAPTSPTSGTVGGPVPPSGSSTPIPRPTHSSPEVSAGGGSVGGSGSGSGSSSGPGSGERRTSFRTTPSLPFTGLATQDLVETGLILIGVGLVPMIVARPRRRRSAVAEADLLVS